MAFQLPELPYSYDALEAAIDAKTMEIHHSKHHNGYVSKLNTALDKAPDWKDKPLEDILANINKLPQEIRTAVRNSGGGAWNHDFFWPSMTPKSTKKPVGSLAEAIDKRYNSFERFREEFTAAATGVFGSGWAWLLVENGELKIAGTPNQDNPLMDLTDVNGAPLLGIDVWEHAYYLRYQNKRPEYVNAFWDVVNWEKCQERYEAATK